MNLSNFLNPIKEENRRFVASKRFQDETGKPIEWEIKSITSEEDQAIIKSCTYKVQVPGRRGQYTQETDYAKYLGLLAVACTVVPNLNSTELQDGYHVMGADSLLKAMLKPGEYAEYLKQVQEINGFDIDMEELTDKAKN